MQTDYQLVLKAMKASGHDRINEIVAMGIHKNAIYSSLSKRLRVSPLKGHFANMRTQEEVSAAILVLEDIRMEVGEKYEKKVKKLKKQEKHVAHQLAQQESKKTRLTRSGKVKPLPSKTLPLKAQKQAIAELQKVKEIQARFARFPALYRLYLHLKNL